MTKIRCPYCGKYYNKNHLNQTYYSRNKNAILKKHKERMKNDPEYVNKKREIARKSYYKRKAENEGR